MTRTTSIRHFRLPRIFDERGNLSVFENGQYFSFDMESVYWLWMKGENEEYDSVMMPSPYSQVLITLAGSMQVVVETAGSIETFTLDDKKNCLHIPARLRSTIRFCSADLLAFTATDSSNEHEHNIIQQLGDYPAHRTFEAVYD